MGMMWFIFSEVMFFGAFFGALFYIRMFSVPWLGGEGHGVLTHQFLWSDYTAAWGANGGNGPAKIGGAFETVPAWGLPLLNTLILLTRSEEHTSELQSLMRISYADFCLKKTK